MTNETSIYDKQIKAANTLEDLAVALKEAVVALRSKSMANDEAYALLYWLRKEFGYVVSDLGYGVPTSAPTHAALKKLSQQSNEIFTGIKH